ncbi:MAG: UDP-glucose 4-epimerase GalE [Candidatus Heteroscillospira sp.]
MSILLTGGAGYIGSHIAVELIEAGYEPVIFDNLSNSGAECIRRIGRITGRSPAFRQGDINDARALDGVFSDFDISCVIHLAGLKSVPESVKKPLDYYRVNVGGLLTLLEAMDRHGVKNFVFSSSATVYGTADVIPYTEETPTGCTNPYGRTKLMCEEILRDKCVSDEAFSAVLLRYFNPIGAHPSGLIGEDPQGVPGNLMPYISRVAVGVLPQLTIYGDDYDTRDGTGVRDYLHVVDLAKGHTKAVAYAASHRGARAFNLGTGRGYSVLELVNTFARVNDVPVPYVVGPRRAGDIGEYYSDCSLAEKELGWTAGLSLEDMCRDSWNWQKNNPRGYGE